MDKTQVNDTYIYDPSLDVYDNEKEIKLFNKWFKTDLSKLCASSLGEILDYHVEIAERERVYLYITGELDKEILTSLTALNGFYLLRGYPNDRVLLSFLLNEKFLPEYLSYKNLI